MTPACYETMCAFERSSKIWNQTDAETFLAHRDYAPIVQMARNSPYAEDILVFLRSAALARHVPLMYELALFEMATHPSLETLTHVVLPLIEAASTLASIEMSLSESTPNVLLRLHRLNQTYTKHLDTLCEAFLHANVDTLYEKNNATIATERKKARLDIMTEVRSGAIELTP